MHTHTMSQRYAGLLALVVLLAASAPTLTHAQADSTASPAWTKSLTAKLTGSQASFRNWQGGGINSYAISGTVGGKASRRDARFIQEHEVKLALGGIRQSGTSLRKAEDLILLTASLRYQGDGFFSEWTPTFGAALRTQFAPGYVYSESKVPAALAGRGVPLKTSDLFAPADFTQTLGLTRNITPYLKQRFGFAAKETIIGIRRLRPVFGNKRDEPVRFEAGLESVTDLDKQVFENVRYTSRVGLFLAFNNPDLPDLIWENTVAMKVNSWLGVNFELATLYDRDVSEALQIREALSVGMTFMLIRP